MIRLLLGGILLLTIVWGSEMIRWRGDYDQALHEARARGKNLLLILTKPSCPACAELIRKIAADPALVRPLLRRYVPVIVTVDVRADYPVELYYTTRFPALFLVEALRELPDEGSCRGRGCYTFLRRRLLRELNGVKELR